MTQMSVRLFSDMALGLDEIGALAVALVHKTLTSV